MVDRNRQRRDIVSQLPGRTESLRTSCYCSAHVVVDKTHTDVPVGEIVGRVRFDTERGPINPKAVSVKVVLVIEKIDLASTVDRCQRTAEPPVRTNRCLLCINLLAICVKEKASRIGECD